MRSASTLIPLADAAVQLHRTREQVLRMIMRGELSGCRAGGRWMVDPVSLLSMLAHAQAA